MKLQKQIQKPEDTTCHLVTKIGDQPSKLAQILKDHGYKIKELQTGERFLIDMTGFPKRN